MRSSVFVSLLGGALLFAVPAQGARLLMPDDLPAASGDAAPTSVEPGKAPSFGLHFGVAAGAGVLAVPLGFGLASLLGNLSNSLIPTAILGLLPMGLVAPLITAFSAWLFGNWNLREADGRFSFWWGFAAAAIVHIAATVVGGFMGVSLAGVPGLLLFSAVDGVLMSAAAVGAQRLFRPAPTIPSTIPAVSATSVLPLSTFTF